MELYKLEFEMKDGSFDYIESRNEDSILLNFEDLKDDNIYIVQVCPKIDKKFYGYPIRKMIYSLNEKTKAQATFNRYKRIYGGNSNVKN